MLAGIPETIRSNFLPVDGTIRAIDEAGVTALVAVPTLLHFLCGVAAKTGWRPRTARYVICGGDRLTKPLRERVEKLLGLQIIEGYGLTECSPIVSAQAFYGSPEGSVGPMLCDMEYKLCDLDG